MEEIYSKQLLTADWLKFNSDEEEDQQLIHDMVWMHDYPKMLGDNDNFELVRELVSKHRSERYTDRLMNQLRWMEEIKSLDWSGRTTTIAAVMSTADALAHYYGPFWQIYMDENPDTPIEELKQSLLELDIVLTVDMNENLHDREIRIDNGWAIKIGRGLDFFQKPDGWSTIGSNDLSLRPCLETNVDIYKL